MTNNTASSISPEQQVELRLELIERRRRLADLHLDEIILPDEVSSLEVARSVWDPELRSEYNFRRLGGLVLREETTVGKTKPMPRFAVPIQDAYLCHRDHYACVYCSFSPLTALSATNGGKGSRTISPDHLVSWTEERQTFVDDMVAACKPCNSAKYTASPETYLKALYLEPDFGFNWRNRVWQGKIQEMRESGYFG